MPALTKENVVKAIEDTGFPLELRAANLFANRGYHVASSLYYVDRDEGKGREIDLRVLLNRQWERAGQTFFVRHCLLVECKRYRKRPWVVFTNASTGYDKRPNQLDLRGGSSKVRWQVDLPRIIGASHPLFDTPCLGRGYTELFRESNQEEADSPIFKAITTAVKATLAAREAKFAAGDKSICVYYPLVVLDGMLWESFLEGKSIDAIEQTSVVVSFFYESPNYPLEGFRVPIVVEAALPAFLGRLEKVLDQMNDYFQSCAEAFADK